MRFTRSVRVAGAALALLLAYFPAASAATFIDLDSEPGDYIGAGIRQTITAAVGPISAMPPAPIAVAGAAQGATEGAAVTLDGSASYDLDGTVTSWQWTQRAGPGVTLSGSNTARASFTAPQVAAGGSNLIFQLVVTDNDGNTGTDSVVVAVRDDADPRSLIYFDSDAGDYIGGGVKQTLTDYDGTFRAGPPYGGGDVGGGVGITFDGGQVQWNLEFGSVDGAGRLQPGTYRIAERAAFASAGHPGLDVFGDGRGCDNVTGRFDVLDVAYGPSGEVQRFAADFEQHCEGMVPALFGSVRFKSGIPLLPRPPSAYATAPLRQPEGAEVTLDASASLDPQQGPLTFQWTQESGLAVTLTAAATAKATFVTPSVSLGGADLVFAVTVTNSIGLSDVARVTVHVVASGDARSLLAIVSVPGEQIGGGVTHDFYDWDGSFTSYPRFGSFINGIEVSFHDPSFSQYWILDFAPAVAAGPLVPGDYVGASAPGFPSSAVPGLSVRNITRSDCYQLPSGRFTVLEAEYGNTGTINDLNKFAVDFVQRCGPGTLPLFGSLRINSAVPVGPRAPSATVAAPLRVTPGMHVTLDSTGTADAVDTQLGYAWSQLGGPAATLSNVTASNPTFVAPVVPAGGADLAFRLRVTNSSGLTDTVDVVVHVVAPQDPTFSFVVSSQPGDPVGHGESVAYSEWDGTYSGLAGPNGTGVSFVGRERWSVLFSPPPGTSQLHVGDYRDAVYLYDVTPGHPGLTVADDAGACYSGVTGRFNILEIEYGPTGDLVRLAADFDQRCEYASGRLFGSVRFNSSVPIGARPPSAYASAPPRILEGFDTVLDGLSSADPQNSTLRFRWTQTGGPVVSLRDATQAIAHFTAPPVPPGGADARFRLDVVNGLGLADSAIVTVHVLDKTDARTVLYLDSRPGSVGNGKTWTFYEWDGTFVEGGYGTSRDSIAIRFSNADHDWFLPFGAALGAALTTGRYNDAQRLAFADPAHPGMDIEGDHQGCNTITGSFRVLEIGPPTDRLAHLAIDFEQRCDGGAPLYGSLRINSALPVTVVPYADFAAQSGVVTSFTGGGSNCRFDNPRWLGPPPGTGEVPATAPGPNAYFPYGLLAFATQNCAQGGAITVTIRYPAALPPNVAYWKFGPTADDPVPHWYVMPAAIAGNTATFTIVDGGLGDDDLTVNGRIVDVGGIAGGVAIPPPPPPPPAPPAPMPIPTLSPVLLALLALALAIAGLPRAQRQGPRRHAEAATANCGVGGSLAICANRNCTRD